MLSEHRLSFSDPLQGSTYRYGGGGENWGLRRLPKRAMQKNARGFAILMASNARRSILMALNARRFAILMALNAQRFAILMAVGRAGLDGVTGTNSQRIYSEARNRNAHAFALDHPEDGRFARIYNERSRERTGDLATEMCSSGYEHDPQIQTVQIFQTILS